MACPRWGGGFMGLSPAGWVGGVARGRRRWLVHRSVHDLVFLVRPVGGWFPLGVGNGAGWWLGVCGILLGPEKTSHGWAAARWWGVFSGGPRRPSNRDPEGFALVVGVVGV